MHVRVEQTGHDRPSTQVDRLRSGAEVASLPDGDDAAVLDRHGGAHDAAAVDESSICQQKIGGTTALRRAESRDLG